MIRVVLVDDHVLFRHSLRELLQSQAGVEVVGEAGDADKAVEVLQQTMPDLVVLDVSMPGRDGLAVSRIILEKKWPIRVLLLTMLSGPDMVRRALDAGAHGLLLKDNTFNELLHALETLMDGRSYLSPALADALPVLDSPKGATGWLTAREEEILRGIASGLTNKQLAKKMHISVKTVDTHRSRIMRKLDAHCVADLVRYAINHGLA